MKKKYLLFICINRYINKHMYSYYFIVYTLYIKKKINRTNRKY